jgi:hypothetical protein
VINRSASVCCKRHPATATNAALIQSHTDSCGTLRTQPKTVPMETVPQVSVKTLSRVLPVDNMIQRLVVKCTRWDGTVVENEKDR